MTQLDRMIDRVRQRHKSSWTGICDTCDLIWPCPPIRTMLNPLVTTDAQSPEEAGETGARHRIFGG
jgi:hypothetical protein